MCQVYQVHKGGQLNRAAAAAAVRLPVVKEAVMVVALYVHADV